MSESGCSSRVIVYLIYSIGSKKRVILPVAVAATIQVMATKCLV